MKNMQFFAVIGRTPTAELRVLPGPLESLRNTDLRNDQGQKAITRSIDIDTSYAWSNQYEPEWINCQLCIIFQPNNLKFVDLDIGWAEPLLSVSNHLDANRTFSPSPIMNFLPAGTQHIVPTDLAKPWYKTWYANLQHPEFVIESSITRFDLTVNHNAYSFYDHIARLSITEDGSLIIPTAPEYLRL
jgi:hypothetical protein